MKKNVNKYLRLRRMIRGLEKHMPDTFDAFEKFQRNKSSKGALSAKTKELIALSLAVSSGSSSAATLQLQEVINSGASDQEIIESIEVVLMMGGTSALVAGSEIVEQLRDFREEHQARHLFDQDVDII